MNTVRMRSQHDPRNPADGSGSRASTEQHAEADDLPARHFTGETNQRMKPRLTADQHADMGRCLAAVLDELTQRHIQLANAYPLSGPEARPAKKLDSAIRALDQARSEMENALYREHPDSARTTVYYPTPSPPVYRRASAAGSNASGKGCSTRTIAPAGTDG